MSKKRSNLFSFLDSSDTESASEGEISFSNFTDKKGRCKEEASSRNPECEVEILKVEPGCNS